MGGAISEPTAVLVLCSVRAKFLHAAGGGLWGQCARGHLVFGSRRAILPDIPMARAVCPQGTTGACFFGDHCPGAPLSDSVLSLPFDPIVWSIFFHAKPPGRA